ncbi:hypothetical protein IGI04_040688 [Brassica rapa subsp. trilocularis]|uniref:C2H2-type domain-containing protein n=1 Tax=Brassica rapa subsp. trilocularis TaxID=1813537 RepID=A0ABQ7KQ55_BRACM|nr:hypothetical protein IGI04_040688 [Brassica rapa subsp. trilocularis]
MDQCRFSLGRPRFGSIKFKVPNSSQPFISQKRKEMEEEDQAEEEAKSLGFREEEDGEDDDGAKSIEEEEKKKHICCECGKRFKSGKALGGHKRIHVLEARKFSMVRPKMVAGAVGRSEERDDFEVDCCRGRRSALKDPPPEDVDAKDLLFLATTAEAVDLDAAETCDSRSVEEMMKKRKKKRKRLSEMEKESTSSHDHHHQLEVGAAEEGGGGAREKHVCVTCNKSFASYQALGGHRASHNKVRISENHQARANSEALLLGTEAMMTGLASAQGPNISLSIGNKGDHVCNICQKSFTTGQALGGHKRCHWPGPTSNEAATAPVPASNESATTAPTPLVACSSSQVTETVQEEKKLKRKFLEFDLNELPPNEE